VEQVTPDLQADLAWPALDSSKEPRAHVTCGKSTHPIAKRERARRRARSAESAFVVERGRLFFVVSRRQTDSRRTRRWRTFGSLRFRLRHPRTSRRLLVKIYDRGIKTAFTAAMADNKISAEEMGKILQSARDGNILTKNERADLERILANHGGKMEPPAKQALVNFLQAMDSCKSGDLEPAPTPQIALSWAFDRAAEGAIFVANSAPSTRPAPAPRDPVYIELRNVELGTTFQLINLSKNPAANFDNKEDVVKIAPTGRDVPARTASIYLTADQMTEMGIQPGDVYQLRAVDHSGNPSLPVTGEFEPDDWVAGRVTEMNGATAVNSRGGQLNALDGEAVRKNLIVKAVNDTRPPQVIEEKLILVTDDRFDENDKALVAPIIANWNRIATAHIGAGANATQIQNLTLKIEDFKALSTHADLADPIKEALAELADNPEFFNLIDETKRKDGIIGLGDFQMVASFQRNVSLSAFGAIEPRSTVQVQNQRTGQTVNATVGDDRQLNLALGDIRDGDPLILIPTDNEGVRGQNIELVYSSKCKDGKAPKLQGGLGARLPGVI
jgi:hypothetical protein